MELATTTLPWPRNKATALLPKVSAKDSPMLWLRMSMSEVSPKVSRISKVGTLLPKKPLIWQIGRRRAPVTPNGMMAGEWLCTTELTSGRFLKMAL